MVWKIYDAVYIYLKLVHNLYDRGLDFCNGSLLRLSAAGGVFEGTQVSQFGLKINLFYAFKYP